MLKYVQRVAQLISSVWRVNSRMEPDPNWLNGWFFQAEQSYQSGVISLSALAYEQNDEVALNLTFSDNNLLQCLNDPAEGIVASLLYGVAMGLQDWTKQKQPWVCTYGTWVKNKALVMVNGEFIDIARR